MAMMKQVLELSGQQTMLLQGAQQSGGFNMSALQHAAGVSLPGLPNQARCVRVLRQHLIGITPQLCVEECTENTGHSQCMCCLRVPQVVVYTADKLVAVQLLLW
jgi:hypothetical protein